jgi:hypothetical protein
MALIDISLFVLALLFIFMVRVAVLHAAAKFLLPPSRDVRLTQAIHLAGIGILLSIIPIPLIGPILFVAYAAKIYDEDRLFALAIAGIAWVAGEVLRIGIDYIGGLI